MGAPEEKRRWYGWGRIDVERPEAAGLYQYLSERIKPWPDRTLPVPDLDELDLRPAEASEPMLAALEGVVGSEQVRRDRFSRVLHALGRSYRDLIRLRLGIVPSPPDVVVYPGDHDQTRAVLKIASQYHAVVVPFGGGSSVVGGLEASPRLRPLISLDTTRMNRVLSIHPASMTARFQAGIFGPDLEKALNAQNLTLGHFPQSFEFSTLGGWIAARGAGHKSVLYGKIEDMVMGLRVALPDRELSGPVVPAHACGGDPQAALVGSEGVLGVITEAEMRLKPLAEDHWFDAWLMPDFGSGLTAVRKAMAAGIHPSTLRLSDETETAALLTEAGRKVKGPVKETIFNQIVPRYLDIKGVALDRACLLLAMGEGRSETIKVDQAVLGKAAKAEGGVRAGSAPAKAWYETRYATPYMRDELIQNGFLVETLETAATWDRLPELYRSVRTALQEALNRSGVVGVVMAHLSHAYAQGANIYFTFMAPQAEGREEEQWRLAKEAACRAIMRGKGALSHHHGVGRDHKPYWEQFWGSGFSAVLRDLKRRLDPAASLNPGAIFDPQPADPSPQAWFQPFSPDVRRANLERLERGEFDLLVVGGGAVGCGTAWDAALRGLSVAVVEKNDFGGGTSGKSSRMIHGGLRYLKMLDLKLVRESLAERHLLMRMAPHLVRPQPHLFPIYKGEGDNLTMMRLGLWGYDTLARGKRLPQHQSLSAAEVLELEPLVSPENLEGGLIYYDCLTDDVRLTLETAKAAARAGAYAVNHAEVVSMGVGADAVEVQLVDRLSGLGYSARARAVVNATGVWSDRVRTAADPESPAAVRPSKGVHIVYPRALKPIHHVVILKGADGRPLFAVPVGDTVYVGTTDREYQGDLDEVHAEVDEVDYILEALNRTLTGAPLARDQAIISWSGLRPLVDAGDDHETVDVSREHEIRLDHQRLVTVRGGKLTTFRLMAAQTVDMVLPILEKKGYSDSLTAGLPLCGPPDRDPALEERFPSTVANRLRTMYGPRASAIMAIARSPLLAVPLDLELGLIAAEVYWVVFGEMAMTLIDAMTRRLGLTYTAPDAGLSLVEPVAQRMAGFLGWDRDRTRAEIESYRALVRDETAYKNDKQPKTSAH